jgi:hypothetical protein
LPTPSATRALRLAAALAAVAAPTLLAYNESPSPTFLNQALALGLWGAFVAGAQPAAPGRGVWPLQAALALLAACAAGSWGAGGLPASLALSALGLLAAAAVVAAAGAGARARPDAEDAFAAFCWALAVTGALNVAIAAVQVFAPGLPDGDWVAASGIPGRAVGNLRQPNHLSSLLTWGCIAVVALLELRRLKPAAAAAWGAALVFAVVLTASRTGLVSVLLLALWALLDRRLARATRALLLAAPLAYALAWWGMAQWAAASAHNFGGAARLAESDISGSRFGIWANTLEMIRQQPWAGVGFGEFNFAWTLTPFPGRPTAFFDHTHNLPLQLAVELGLPLAAGVSALLLWALWRAAVAAWGPQGSADAMPPAPGLALAQRCAVVMVLMIGLHSLLEYPLWYAYFLLPAAWAWGFALPGPGRANAGGRAPAAGAAAAGVAAAQRTAAQPSAALGLAGLVLLAGAAYSVRDYQRVTVIFSSLPGAAPLAARVAAGQSSVFFSHHADYAAVTSGVEVADSRRAFARATHYLLDTRLMAAWAEALAASGDVRAAQHVAARLREFRKADAAEFFAPCDAAGAPATAASAPLPFQCAPPGVAVPWRAFIGH